MTKEGSIIAEVADEKLAKNSLYGEVASLRQPRKLKGTAVSCFVCGGRNEMLYKDDVGYICRTCRRKRDLH